MNLPDESKEKLKHYRRLGEKKKRDAQKLKNMKVIKDMKNEYLDRELKKQKVPKTIDEANLAERLDVLETLYECGIPSRKLDNPRFYERMTKGQSLGGRRGIEEMFPALREKKINDVKQEVTGRPVSLVMDGSKANKLIEGLLCRFVSDKGEIVQRCVGVKRVRKTVTGVELKGIITNQIQGAGLVMDDVECVISDSAGINGTAVDSFNDEVSQLYQKERMGRSIFYVRCFSHMITNAGTRLREACSRLELFMQGMKGLRKSDSAKFLWSELTGDTMPDGTPNRWFSWYEWVEKVLVKKDVLFEFLRTCKHRQFMKKKVGKMTQAYGFDHDGNVNWRQRLEFLLEMKLTVLVGKPLVKACYNLEGDGFLAPYAYSILSTVQNHLFSISEGLGNERSSLFAFAEAHRKTVGMDVVQQVVSSVWKKRLALTDYWTQQIWNGMEEQIALFKGFSVLDPVQLVTMNLIEMHSRLKLLVENERPSVGVFGSKNYKARKVLGLKGFAEEQLETILSEFSFFRTAADLKGPVLSIMPWKDQPAELWRWWWGKKDDTTLPTFYWLAMKAVLHQPSSAALERFFSIVKGSTSSKQNAEMEETMETRYLCLYNNKT